MKSGSKFKFSITFDAQILSDSDNEIPESQIIDTIYSDEAFGLKSVIIGNIRGLEKDKQIDIIWDSSEVKIL